MNLINEIFFFTGLNNLKVDELSCCEWSTSTCPK